MIGEPRHARHAALTVGLILCAVYAATGAALLTFWDASEFATAIGTLGIPHPPGTPLYVAIGSSLWHLVPAITPVQAGTLLSVLATGTACAVAAWIIVRVSGRRSLGIVSGLCAGAMGTVWMNATETEVYSVSLLCVALQLAAAWRAHVADDDRARVLVAYAAAIALPLHLSALVAAPAAMLLANMHRDGSVRWRPLANAGLLVLATALLSHGLWLPAFGCLAAVALQSRMYDRSMRWLLPASGATLLAWSAVLILLVRARQSPFLNQGDPDTLRKLLDVISRVQYSVAPLWPRQAPFWLQLGNIGQYADWQVALSVWNEVTPSWSRTPLTLCAALLGAVGAAAHWRMHRISARVAVVLFLLASLGVCLQLNLKAGPSFGVGILAPDATHEARERDYFFALAFWCWGLWIGGGAWVATRRLPKPVLLAALLPALMLAGSWRAVNRGRLPDKAMAATMAAEFLHDVPRNAMLFTAGDNDSYPLWYLQQVDSVRRDVQVVVTSLLPANWYFRESAWRAIGFTADTALTASVVPRAGVLARQQLERNGQIAVTILVSTAVRAEIGRIAGVTCWRRFGLVEVGTRREVCPPRISAERTVESSQRMRLLLSAPARASPDGMVQAFQQIARCPGLAATAAIQGLATLDSTSRRLLDITCNLQ